MASRMAWQAMPCVEPTPGRHLDGPGARLAQESHPSLSPLDDRRRSVGVDQYPYYPGRALLSPLYPAGVVYASPREGPHAAYVDARGGELSGRAPATARFTHATSVLSAREQAYG